MTASVVELYPKQRCNKCGGWYDREAAFRRNKILSAMPDKNQFRPTCTGCEQTARDTTKHKDPFIEKARSTIRRHAEKRKMTKAEFIAAYGWDLERVAHKLRHDYENTCTYCRRPYSSMLNGIADITIDIINPADEPFLEINTTPCCLTCNSSKRDLPPNMWARKLRFWREWEINQQNMRAPVQMSLLDDLEAFQ